ncbi:MAG: ABC transporter ATP-binding protein [marine bacterium B5-7]|nr:MAG: ABC transporter ATP-binding protein [marine bacterium B5-7]
MTEPVLNLHRVSRSFTGESGDVYVLKDINLSINQGDFVMVTGPSGSGKSTLLHVLSLLLHPSTGEVEFLGRSLSKASEADLGRIRAQHLGIVFQHYGLLGRRSALENVKFRFRYLADFLGDANSSSVEALRSVGLEGVKDRPARLLSGGEKQRVAIARAVAAKPQLVVADEPTGNLDHTSALVVMEVLAELNRAGYTLIMVTHNTDLLHFASRHLTLTNGMLQEMQN